MLFIIHPDSSITITGLSILIPGIFFDSIHIHGGELIFVDCCAPIVKLQLILTNKLRLILIFCTMYNCFFCMF